MAGIDTHKDTHHIAILVDIGRAVMARQFMATLDGYRRIVDFMRSAGTVERIGIEGTGSYGAGLTRILNTEGFNVAEVGCPFVDRELAWQVRPIGCEAGSIECPGRCGHLSADERRRERRGSADTAGRAPVCFQSPCAGDKPDPCTPCNGPGHGA